MSTDTQALQAEVDRLRLELKTFHVEAGVEKVSIGNYLLTRLAQLGDLVEDHPQIDWVGNCNELNAAYAADGYARIKEGSIGVLTTTFGVGELSAMNGIAGAFSEMVPVLHIVGVPNTAQQKTRPLLHHTLGDGRYDAYGKAASQFTICQQYLMDTHTAAEKIDHAITECITKARPVYLTLPTDLVYREISSERLKMPLSRDIPFNQPEMEQAVVDLIYGRVKAADGDVVVIVDACVIRHNVRKEVDELLKATGFPVYATPMGKTAVDESYFRYGGIYVGSLTHPDVKAKVENAKLVLSIGSLGSDFNTGSFSWNIPKTRQIEFHSTYTEVNFARFNNIGMKHLLPKITERLLDAYHPGHRLPVPAFVKRLPEENTPVTILDLMFVRTLCSSPPKNLATTTTDLHQTLELGPDEHQVQNSISHLWFWPRVGYFFRPKDVIITETGTANFGILDVPLPSRAVLVNQILWGSIGWSVGSTLGAALAAKDVGMERVILFVGDGSLQLSVQEISPMIRKGLKPIIFVLNNKGYSIERYIHGKYRRVPFVPPLQVASLTILPSGYNDVANWKWSSLLDTLNDGGKYSTASYTVNNKEELSELLDNEAFAAADKLQLVEVTMDALDAPLALERQAELTGKGNAYAA
ncbi:hypothetical protein NLJ89_g7695 [Agrocybe chaxingu]|uniref:Pyruvate decarboxylase n=1 Tax=Agrocybe chaxingu TaxID=84603 RepID=A0A9W8JW53_9AGAR|nr:hypothetical protein NLJ89_g7695 [Agrocybe chaxingu]